VQKHLHQAGLIEHGSQYNLKSIFEKAHMLAFQDDAATSSTQKHLKLLHIKKQQRLP
jgi:hypothetical protein